MDILIKVSQLLLSLSLLIVLHEFGHYIAARIFKTRVEKFYLFFDAWGKKLFSFKKGDTEYGIGWLPLGGYVKITGMIDESMDKEQMKQEPQAYEFRSKPAWQRLIIMLGGVTVNFILGILIYIMIVWVWGEEVLPVNGAKSGYAFSETFESYGFKDGDQILLIDGQVPKDLTKINKNLLFRNYKNVTVQHQDGTQSTIELPKDVGKTLFEKGDIFPIQPRRKTVIDTVLTGFPAQKSGIKKGDILLAVDEKPIKYFDELSKALSDKEVKLTILRGTDTLQIATKPEIKDREINKYQIGINSKLDSIETQKINYSLGSSIARGNVIAIETFKDFINQFKYLFTKKGATELGGFIAIGKIFPNEWDWMVFWKITAFLSIMLAIMNLLPIPALDGGHAMFVIFEMLTGRKPSDKFLEYAQMVGFAILMTLILYANGNDIFKLVKGWF